MTAHEIVISQLESWGEREVYLVTIEELKTLCSNGGIPIEKNKCNKDGTFFNSVDFGGRIFCASTTEEITAGET